MHPVAPPGQAEPLGPLGIPPLAPPGPAVPPGPPGMLPEAPSGPTVHGPPPGLMQPGSAPASGAAMIAAAAAPARKTEVSEVFFSAMCQVYRICRGHRVPTSTESPVCAMFERRSGGLGGMMLGHTDDGEVARTTRPEPELSDERAQIFTALHQVDDVQRAGDGTSSRHCGRSARRPSIRYPARTMRD